ncbi:MAG: hypothetical protein ACRDNF_02320 [Streptosporangiaceae bacterium]
MSGGYTYTTITGGPEEPVRIGVSFYLDDAARIRNYGVGEDRAQFGIAHGDVEVTFAVPHGQVSEDDARVGRELADKAAIYAAEVERLHAEHEARVANSAA